MKIEDEDDGILITTTDIHLARGIGEALHHAYQSELEYRYSERENLLRAVWQRQERSKKGSSDGIARRVPSPQPSRKRARGQTRSPSRPSALSPTLVCY